MKRMKKLVSIRSIPILALALLIVLGTALAAPKGEKVTGFGSWKATDSDYWAGDAPPHTTLYIGGVEFKTVDSELQEDYTVNILDPLQKGEDGVYRSSKAEQVFHFGDGNTIRTLSTVVLEPTGEKPAEGNYTLKLKSWYISGTGECFEGITGGKLNVTGVIKFWPPSIWETSTANFAVNGSIEGSIIYPEESQ